MSNIPEISIPAEKIGQIGPLVINNAMMAFIGTSLILIILAFLIRRNAGIKPTRLQVAFEVLVEEILGKMTLAFGSEKKARKFFPLIFTIFIFFLLANQFMLIPFVESIVTPDGISLFRLPASDYSLPIAYALFVIILSHVLAFSTAPIKHIGNFIKLKQFTKIRSIKEIPMAFIDFFLGILDLVGEFAKLISISTRLFGNMFAGGIVIAIISGLTVFTRYFVPIPFVVLGILSGLVQAFVFAMLSILYISSITNAVKPQEQAN